ncbi:hypothetical protein Ate02nite_09710 [Paractinoplanes tereljensis]|uniref:Uncharacterized protein n=1 Tax=Paractinoplanes tereljensis TaxID=571912 RepID=A0A919NGL5_9ACTN|nr:hypothetical protein Ate02nite_09710 [Actinoplanes tereljensis]
MTLSLQRTIRRDTTAFSGLRRGAGIQLRRGASESGGTFTTSLSIGVPRFPQVNVIPSLTTDASDG